MNTLLLLIICIAVLICGYIFYGGWLCKQWGVGENKEEIRLCSISPQCAHAGIDPSGYRRYRDLHGDRNEFPSDLLNDQRMDDCSRHLHCRRFRNAGLDPFATS